MAGVLNVKPADLTALSKQTNGKFDAPRVSEIIRNGGDISGHGTAPCRFGVWSLAMRGRAERAGRLFPAAPSSS
jgi:hypothetical protein